MPFLALGRSARQNILFTLRTGESECLNASFIKNFVKMGVGAERRCVRAVSDGVPCRHAQPSPAYGTHTGQPRPPLTRRAKPMGTGQIQKRVPGPGTNVGTRVSRALHLGY